VNWQLEIAVRLGKGGGNSDLPQTERHYKNLRTKLRPVEKGEDIYATLLKYLQNSHAKLHSGSVRMQPLAQNTNSLFQSYC
jgi:hypothetical protein